MIDTKLALLRTEFTPEKITFTIEIVPMGEELFDAPIEKAGEKLDAVAAYAKNTLGIRTSQLETKKDGVAEKPADLPEIKLIKKGDKRVIMVFERELARAEAEKNPAAIEKAKAALARVKEKIKARPE